MTRRAAIVALIVVVFLGGISLGVIVDRWMMRAPVLRARVTTPDMSAVLDRLQLTPAQRATADSIVARRAPSSERAMIEVAQHLQAVADSVDHELRAILTPAQRVRLDSLGAMRPRFMLRRKMMAPGGTRIDTVVVP